MTLMGLPGGIYRPLSEKQIETIHNSALSILDKTGVIYDPGIDEIITLLEKSGARMEREKNRITFPPELIKEPLIHSLGQRFKVVTNIRRADINGDKGWVVLELEGETGDIEHGIAWVSGKGVRVDPVIGDIVEG